MLNKRFTNNHTAILKLDRVSFEAKSAIEDKINKGVYVFEKVPCCICNSEEFEQLAEKDRYGLYVSTVICKSCSLVQTNPRMTQKSYEEFYNNEYRRLYQGVNFSPKLLFDNQYNTLGPRVYNFLASNLKVDLKNKFIVEVGCGAGGVLKYFRDRKNEVFGLDLGMEEVRYAKKEYDLNVEFGTIEKIQSSSQKPDIIIYCHVLEHTLNPLQELIKLKKYVMPQTVIYIEVPGIKNIGWSYNEDFLQYLQNAHLYHFSLATLKRLAFLAGFKLLKGNEIIYSIFIQNNVYTVKNIFKNDYPFMIKFLKSIEIIRLLPFSPYKLIKRFKKLVRKIKRSVVRQTVK